MSEFPSALLDRKGSPADSFKWHDASVEDGVLYARAEALGASSVVLARKEMTLAYISTKESVQGKPLAIIFVFNSNVVLYILTMLYHFYSCRCCS